MSEFDLRGASAIVTGAGSGINFEFAKALHEKGCNVVIADIALRPESQAFVDSASSEHGGAKVVFQRTDVTHWAQLEQVFDVAEQAFGAVPTVVCPGAGIYEPPSNGYWADQDKDSHYKILDVNLLHPLKMNRIAVRRLQGAQTRGVILHIASIAGQTASMVTPLYHASKHGVDSFVRGMERLDELCGVRVVGVAPGAIETPLLMDDPEISRWVNQDKDTMLHPRTIAEALIALAENKGNKYPAGTVLEVCDPRPDHWRIVPLFNNPGPSGVASGLSNKDTALEQIKGILRQDQNSAR